MSKTYPDVYIKTVYGYIENGHYLSQKGGSEFKNELPKLPQKDSYGNKIEYREFDVNSKIPSKPRDRERFIRGSDGQTYYTNDHYETFTRII